MNIQKCSEPQNPQKQDRRDTSVLLELCLKRKKRLFANAIDVDNELTLLLYLLHNFIVFLIIQLTMETCFD